MGPALTVFVDSMAKHLERAGNVHCVEVVIQAEEHLDLGVGIPILFDNCTHLDGICDRLMGYGIGWKVVGEERWT